MDERLSGPVSDLTYRGYDGPLSSVKFRWWAIARHQMLRHLTNRWAWVLAVVSGWYYFIMIAIFFVIEQMASSDPNMLKQFVGRVNWVDQFLLGFSFSQLIYFALAINFGASTIANDNRANALLVYLGKPCTKFDYVLGKWLGVFLPLFGLQLLMTTIFWLYGVASFGDYGFIKHALWMELRMIPVHAVSASLLASIAIGISSLFQNGRLAVASMAASYFILNFFSQFIVLAISEQLHNNGFRLAGVNSGMFNLYYCCIDGLQIGLAKVLLGTDGSPPFGAPSPMPNIPIPSAFAMFSAWALICGTCLFIAWRRVRAVEVVG